MTRIHRAEKELSTEHYQILATYVSNAAEFHAKGPEIKYFISEGLDEDSKSNLITTNGMLSGDVHTRSQPDKDLMKCRNKILKRVRLRNKCYPKLISRFVPPPRIPDDSIAATSHQPIRRRSFPTAHPTVGPTTEKVVIDMKGLRVALPYSKTTSGLSSCILQFKTILLCTVHYDYASSETNVYTI